MLKHAEITMSQNNNPTRIPRTRQLTIEGMAEAA
jgi:hypothetical protein